MWFKLRTDHVKKPILIGRKTLKFLVLDEAERHCRRCDVRITTPPSCLCGRVLTSRKATGPTVLQRCFNGFARAPRGSDPDDGQTRTFNRWCTVAERNTRTENKKDQIVDGYSNKTCANPVFDLAKNEGNCDNARLLGRSYRCFSIPCSVVAINKQALIHR